MNWIGIITTLLTVVNILICLLLIFVVLLQRPKNEGLGAAFGGDTASNIFGAQTTNVLATLTRWLGGIFLTLCFVIAILGKFDAKKLDATAAFLRTKAAERQAEADKKKASDAMEAEAAIKKALEKGPAGTPLENTSPAAVTPPVQAPDPNKPPTPAGTPAPAPAPAPGTTPPVAPATDKPAAPPTAPAPGPAPATPILPAAEPAKTPAPATPTPASPTPATPEPAKTPSPEPPKAPAPSDGTPKPPQ